MSDAPAKPISDTKGKDKEMLVSIVKEMTESMTGAQSTRHWAEDALWFDIPPFASRGIQPALKFFEVPLPKVISAISERSEGQKSFPEKEIRASSPLRPACGLVRAEAQRESRDPAEYRERAAPDGGKGSDPAVPSHATARSSLSPAAFIA